MKKLYVAYGSNLNIAQMALRCPTAHIYGTGLLNNWELIYRGSMTGSYATIRRRKGSAVPVVVWSIMENDEKSLDIYEGYPRFYFKQNVMVDLPSGKKKAMVYIMDLKRKPGRPSQRYVESIWSAKPFCLHLKRPFPSLSHSFLYKFPSTSNVSFTPFSVVSILYLIVLPPLISNFHIFCL